MVDHHVDRPGVEAGQPVKLTGTNRSIGFIALIVNHHQTNDPGADNRASKDQHSDLRRPGGYGGEKNTRSHPELGRETPQRQWYFVTKTRESRSLPGLQRSETPITREKPAPKPQTLLTTSQHTTQKHQSPRPETPAGASARPNGAPEPRRPAPPAGTSPPLSPSAPGCGSAARSTPPGSARRRRTGSARNCPRRGSSDP